MPRSVTVKEFILTLSEFPDDATVLINEGSMLRPATVRTYSVSDRFGVRSVLLTGDGRTD
jgi:hypothetical protein